MSSTCINISVDFKPILKQKVSRFWIHTAFALGADDVSEMAIVRGVSIAHTAWWPVESRIGQFLNSDTAGSGSNEQYRWTTRRHEAQSFPTTCRPSLWNESIWDQWSLWDFSGARAVMLGIGQHGALACKHVLVFESRWPVDGLLVTPTSD